MGEGGVEMINAIKNFSVSRRISGVFKSLYELKYQAEKDYDTLDRLDKTCQFLMSELVSASMLETKYERYGFRVRSIEKDVVELGVSINRLEDRLQLIEARLSEGNK
jgi:hypothetical protein